MHHVDWLRKSRQGSKRGTFDAFCDAHDLEEIRQALRREIRVHHGQRLVARAIGVSRSVIRKFIEMRSVPRVEHLREIRDWAADRPEVHTEPGAVCLAMLACELSPTARYRARLRLAAALAEAFDQAGEEAPEWLRNELEDRRVGRSS